MSAAANAAAFLSMRRRLPEEAGPKAHVTHASPRPRPALEPAQAAAPVRVAVLHSPAVQVVYRKRRRLPL
jgi:hypothetical protein